MSVENALQTFFEVQLWKEALASTAIEGNKYSQETLDLMKSDNPKDQLEWWKRFQESREAVKG